MSIISAAVSSNETPTEVGAQAVIRSLLNTGNDFREILKIKNYFPDY